MALVTYLITGKARYAKIIGEPVGGYPNGTGPKEWTFDLVVSEETKKQLLKLGMSSSYIKETKEGEEYVKFTRKAVKMDGSQGKAFEIIDHHGQDWDDRKIGNDSTLNVQITFNTVGSGKTAKLKPSALKLQVYDFVAYKPGGGAGGFPVKAAEEWTDEANAA